MNFRRVRWMVMLSLCSMALAVPGLAMAARASEGSAARPRSTSGNAAVAGLAVGAENAPVPTVKVRLRDVRTGAIAAIVTSDSQGGFGFSGIEPGWYAVELVGDDGKALAVGQPFRVASGETATTVVRIAPRRPRWAGVLSNAAVGVIAAASSAGVTALGSAAPAASPH